MTRKQHGFSLVELSIVLVILGLLVGGILGGQALIRAAELHSISADLSRYQSAIYAFKGKYFAWPGDMDEATRFWGEIDADPATCLPTDSTGMRETCDGNGNGRIGEVMGGTPELYQHESHRAWQHLSNAGIVDVSVTGTGYGYEQGVYGGINAPASKVSGASFSLTHSLGWGWTFDDIRGNVLMFGTSELAPNETPNWNPGHLPAGSLGAG